MSLVAYVPTVWVDYADSPDLQAVNLNHFEEGIEAVTDELIAFEAWAAANYQPISAELTAIASLSSPGYVKRLGAGSYGIVASIPQADVSGLTASLAGKEPAITTLAANRGGTGNTSYAIGDLLYASSTTALSRLADVATGNVLRSGGVGVAPAWGKVSLAHMATMPSGTMLGNATGTDATPQALDFIQVRALLNLTGPFLTMTNPTWFGAAKTATGTLALEPLLSGGLLKATYGTGVIALADSYDVTAALGYVPVSGSGSANQVAIWSGENAVSGSAAFTHASGVTKFGGLLYRLDPAVPIAFANIYGDGTASPSDTNWSLSIERSGSSAFLRGSTSANLSVGSIVRVAATTSGVTLAGTTTLSSLTGGSTRLATISPSGALGAASTFPLVGVTDGSSASSGVIGQFLEAKRALGSAVTQTDSVATNITSLSLTAGDWMVWGVGSQTVPSGTLPVGFAVCISTSVAMASDGTEAVSPTRTQTEVTAYSRSVTPRPMRFSVSSTTTVYLVGISGWSGTAPSAYGSLCALRIR